MARRRRLTALVAAVLVGSAPAHAQTWNAGTGDWFIAGNWNPAVVPAAGGSVIVSNGGTATLNGSGTTAALSSLSIGNASNGTGTGTVQSIPASASSPAPSTSARRSSRWVRSPTAS